MNITSQIKANHQTLSGTSVRFLEYVEKHPEALEKSGFNILKEKVQNLKLQAWPVFINQNTRAELEEAAVKVFKLLRRVPRCLFNNDPGLIGRYFDMPEDVVKIQLDSVAGDRLDNLIARADFMLTQSGLKCMEYNVSSKVGGMQISYWEQMYATIPIVSEFMAEQEIKPVNKNVFAVLLEHFLRIALKKFPTNTEFNMVIVIPRYIKGAKATENQYVNQVFKNLLQMKYKKTGSIFFCDWGHLKTINGSLYYNHKPVHIVMEMYHGVLPEEVHDVYNKGNICLFNGPATKLFSSKFQLTALSEYENSDLFSPAERETIKKYIPWTRKVVPGDTRYRDETVKLEEFVLANREGLVLKPALGISGSGIFIGKNTPAPQWEQVVAQALKGKDYLVQEYAESLTHLFRSGENGCAEYISTWGLFVFGNTYAGGWVRILPTDNKKGVINSGQGAEESVVLVINE